jgi:multidrug efflux pump subunit AcrB
MKNLISFSVKHPVSVLMYFCLATLLGLVSLFLINVDYLPDAKDRFLIVNANYQGAKAKEIRRLISIPLEENLSSLKGIKNIESLSCDGRSWIKIELKWNVDADKTLLDTKALLDAAVDFLPRDCPKPSVQKAQESDDKAVKILVIPKEESLSNASAFINDELKRKILSFDDTAYVKTFGLTDPEIKVIVDSKLSSYYGLSLEDIAQTLTFSNFDYPAGTVQDGENDILLKTEGSFKNFTDILETNLKTNEGPLKLKHLASVTKSDKDIDAFCLYNGKACGELLVFCKKKHNPIKLSNKIKAILKEMAEEKSNYEFILESDSAAEIKSAMRNLILNAVLGCLIAFLLLLGFFKSIKIALSIAAVIPSSLLFTSLVLLSLNKTLNIISISGMTICLGMIIDNNIVAIESGIENKSGKDFSKKIEEAFLSVKLSNTASTITSAIVFVPLFFIGGIIGELFIDLAISVMSGLFLSLVYSFTVLPALCLLFLEKELKAAEPFGFSWIESKRKKILKITNPIKGLCPALAAFFLLAATLVCFPIRKELQPSARESYFCEKINFPCGTNINLIKSKAAALSLRLREIQEIKSVLVWGGKHKDDMGFNSSPDSKKECVFIKVSSAKISKSKKDVKKTLDSLLLEHSLQEKKDLISERLEISDEYLLTGQDDDALLNEAKELFGNNFFPCEISEQRTFIANKELMDKLKISPYVLSKTLKNSFNGSPASSYFENGKEIPITVQFEKKEYSAEDKLDSLKIVLGQDPIHLSTLGRWKSQSQESLLFRRNGKDAKIVGKAIAKKAAKPIKKRLLSMQDENLKALLLDGIFLLALVLALLYCILGAETESLCLPLYYLTAVPPSFFGAAFTLLIFGSSLNINTIVAFMLLFGTSVNNSIILHESGGKKTSTVFITSATSIACLLPFAFDPFRLNPQSSLSLAVAGGLVFSTAAVLIMTPNILHWSEK